MTRPDIPVTISGNSRAFEASLQRVRNVARSTATEVGDAFNRVKSKIGGLSGTIGTLSGGPGGLAAALGVGALVSASQQAVTAVLDVGKAAKTAGIDFEAFQELKYAADQNRIGGGIAFWPFGHNSNLTAFYTRIDTAIASRAVNQFNVQWQLYFF